MRRNSEKNPVLDSQIYSNEFILQNDIEKHHINLGKLSAEKICFDLDIVQRGGGAQAESKMFEALL